MTFTKRIKKIAAGLTSSVAVTAILGASLPASASAYVCKTYLYSGNGHIYYNVKARFYNNDFQHMHNIYMLDSNQTYRQSVTLKPGQSATLYVTATYAAGYQINNATGIMAQRSIANTQTC